MTKDRLAALQAVSFVKTILEESMKKRPPKKYIPTQTHIYACTYRMRQSYEWK